MTVPSMVWLVTRGEDPGARVAADELTGRDFAEQRWIEDEYNGDEGQARLRWDETGELIDDALPDDFQSTGWAVTEEPVIRPAAPR
ncbi:hypothetical protein [Streptomyces sp. NBC_00470]|uniref:hypothetical protein n=1 Tax=Streptomyces sp. NBC_00470 TaxID=2975753 RepID=UPI002F919AC4